MYKWMTLLGLGGGITLLLGCVLVAGSLGRAFSQSSTPDTRALVPTPSGPVSVPVSGPYVAMARAAAMEAGLSPDLFVRQIQVESGFNPRALSPAGAEGIAQFMPATAAGLGINPWDPRAALVGAARLMASYVKGYQGDYAKALAAYNSGTGGVEQAVTLCSAQALPWQQCLPAETQKYLALILASATIGGPI